MLSQSLATIVSVRQRFARSVNLERDAAQPDLEGYILTARALDVITRVVAALRDNQADRAISITGPYGSGKSSLALFLALLLGPAGSSRDKADALLSSSSPELKRSLAEARKQSGNAGFILCTVVAQREPIVTTLLRALRVGVLRYAMTTAVWVRAMLAGQGRLIMWAWFCAATALALGAGYLFTMLDAQNAPDPISVGWQFLATIVLYPFADLLIDLFEDADVRFR